MDLITAKSKINSLTDPGIKEVANLLLDIGLELVGCGEDARIINNNVEIGKIDLVYKDAETEKFFIIEVSTRKTHVHEKVNSFFQDGAHLKILF